MTTDKIPTPAAERAVRRSITLIAAALLLGSCGQQDIASSKVEAQSEGLRSLQQAKPVPPLVGQALALRSSVLDAGLGAQDVAGTQAATVLAEDFNGLPFYYLTLVTSASSDDFWSLVMDASPSRQDKLTATGASTARTVYAFEYDEAFTVALRKTRQAAGSVARLVVVDGGVVWLQDQRGQYWDVYRQRVIPADQVADAKATYARLVERNAAIAESTEDGWDDVLADPSVAPLMGEPNQMGSQGLRNFARSDGNINVTAFVKRFGRSGDVKAQWDDVAERGFLNRVKSRAGIAGSGLTGPQAMAVTEMESQSAWSSLKSLDFGNKQRARIDLLVATPEGKTWGQRSAFSGATPPRTDWDLLGCVPLAYARAFATIVQKDTTIKAGMIAKQVFSASDSVGEQIRKTIAWLASPVQANSMPAEFIEPYITSKMGGGVFRDGTLVTPPGLVDGGAAALSERLNTVAGVSNYGLRFDGWGFADPTGNGGIAAGSNPATYWGITPSGYQVGPGDFNAGTQWTRTLVQRTMQDAGLPVMFFYSTGDTLGLGGHMGISGAYRAYEFAGGYTDVYLYTSGDTGRNLSENVGGPTGWINVTNRWSAYGGVYALGPAWAW